MTRKRLAAIPDTSIPGHRVAREFVALTSRRGKPGMIVSDDGAELTSNAAWSWAQELRITWRFIIPRSPIRLRRHMPLGLPRHEIGCATPTSRADRMLLKSPRKAQKPPRL